MARAFVADGVTVVADTPILPGRLPEKSHHNIRKATLTLQAAIDREGIPLKLVTGADVPMVPDMIAGLRSASCSPSPIRATCL